MRNHDVNAVGPVTDVRVDPVELFTQLLNIHKAGAQYTQPTGFAHCHYHVAAVCVKAKMGASIPTSSQNRVRIALLLKGGYFESL